MKRLGALGTMVWDTIHAPGTGGSDPVEEWGGICYGYSAFEAAAPDGWELLPIVKVGADLRDRADEYLHGVLHKLKFRITKVVPNRTIEYRSVFPLSLLAPGNKFLIEPRGGNRCVFVAQGSLRLPRWLFERLHKKHKGKIEATKRHMKEEGENLKRAVERDAARM